jgi:hypothetical protein
LDVVGEGGVATAGLWRTLPIVAEVPQHHHLRRAPMRDYERYRTSILLEAARELEVATTHAAMNAADKKVMDAKAQVKRLQAKAATAEA